MAGATLNNNPSIFALFFTSLLLLEVDAANMSNKYEPAGLSPGLYMLCNLYPFFLCRAKLLGIFILLNRRVWARAYRPQVNEPL